MKTLETPEIAFQPPQENDNLKLRSPPRSTLSRLGFIRKEGNKKAKSPRRVHVKSLNHTYYHMFLTTNTDMNALGLGEFIEPRRIGLNTFTLLAVFLDAHLTW